MSLADRIIDMGSGGAEPDYFGIDERGIPAPCPLNHHYVVARIVSEYPCLYRRGGEIYVNNKLVERNVDNIFILCGRPRIVLWNGNNFKKQWEGAIDREIKRDRAIIWSLLYEMIPDHNKRYIRVTDTLVWDKEKADFLVIPER